MKVLCLLICLFGSWSARAQQWNEVSRIVYGERKSGIDVDGRYMVQGDPLNESIIVYYYDGLDWVKQAVIAGEKVEEEHTYFGSSVAISGNTIVVGTYTNDTEKKKIHVFVRSQKDSWVGTTRAAVLSVSKTGTYGGLRGDIDIEGNIVIARGNGEVDESNVASGGGVYLYKKPESGWKDMTETAKLTTSDLGHKNNFGVSIAINNNTIASGAVENYTDGNGQGAVYVYNRPAAGWKDMIESAKLVMSDGKGGELFGYHLAVSDNMIVAATSYQNHMNDKLNPNGLYVYDRPQEGWRDTVETARLTVPDEKSEHDRGPRVVISENTIIAGVYKANTFQGDYSGILYLYERPEGGWVDTSLPSDTILPVDISEESELGYGLAQDGHTIVALSKGSNEVDGNHIEHTVTHFFQLNVPPQVNISIADVTAKLDSILTFTIPDSTFTDSNHDRLTYQATLVGGQVLPAWLSFNEATGAFSGTPPDSDSLSIEVFAIDPYQKQTRTTFQLFVQVEHEDAEEPVEAEENEEMKEEEGEEPTIVEEPKIEETEEDTVTSIDDTDISLLVYPNPSRGEITVSNLDEPTNITILNSQGSVVLSQQTSISRLKIDTSAFSSGIYTMMLQSSRKTDNVRLIISAAR